MRRARDVYRSIEQAEADLRAAEGRLSRQLAELAEESAELRRAEAAAYRTLAQHRLDRLAREKITDRLDRAERAALDALEIRKRRLAEIEAERAALESAQAEAAARRESAEDAVEAAAAELDALAETTAAALEDDPDYAARRAALEAAEAKAAAADAKADRAEADRAEKSKAYDADPLFSYLWARAYDTPAYRGSGFVKSLDAWVAKLIGYARARPDYTRLQEIPARLRGHADRLAEAAEAARGELEALERARLEAAGAAPLEAKLAEAQGALDAVEAEIDRLETDRAALEEEAARLVDPERDEGLVRALDGLAESFKGADLRRLAEAARATPGPEDDRAVARLADISDTEARLARELARARAEERDIARRRADLAAERRRFRSRGYGAPGGGFDNADALGGILGDIVKGAARGTLADALGKSYRRPSRRRRSGFGGLRFPSGGGSSSGSGGFRTGGGF